MNDFSEDVNAIFALVLFVITVLVGVMMLLSYLEWI